MGDLRPAQASDIHPQAAPGPPEAQLPWDEPAARLLSAAVGGSQGDHGDSAEGGEGVSGAGCHPRGAGGPCEISPRVPREAGWGPGPGGSAVGRGASREAEGRPWGCKARRPTRPEDRKGLRQKASAFPLARTSLRDDGTFNRGKLQGQQSACENCHRQRPAPPGRGPNGRPGQAVGSLSAEPLPLQPDASGSRPCAPDSGQLFWFLWGYF